MKIATYLVGGERRVGVVDDVKQTISPFDLSQEEASRGLMTLIGRATLPAILNSMPLREATLEAPIPRPDRNIFCVGKTITNTLRNLRPVVLIQVLPKEQFRLTQLFSQKFPNVWLRTVHLYFLASQFHPPLIMKPSLR